MIREGAPAPEFRLDQVDGGPITLSDVLAHGHHALLIFLRYLG
ncbi:MAG: hypothetical protein OES12_12880 [Anaerolineae bacterium]|nr:hypothetical protein [Anaerolineae bacterium]